MLPLLLTTKTLAAAGDQSMLPHTHKAWLPSALTELDTSGGIASPHQTRWQCEMLPMSLHKAQIDTFCCKHSVFPFQKHLEYVTFDALTPCTSPHCTSLPHDSFTRECYAASSVLVFCFTDSGTNPVLQVTLTTAQHHRPHDIVNFVWLFSCLCSFLETVMFDMVLMSNTSIRIGSMVIFNEVLLNDGNRWVLSQSWCMRSVVPSCSNKEK